MAIDTVDSDSIHFFGGRSPLGDFFRRDFSHGVSVDDMLLDAEVLPEEGLPLVVLLNGDELDYTLWETTYPAEGDFVYAYPRPGFGVGEAILALSLAEIVANVIVYGVISYALNAVVNAIIGPPKQNQNSFANPSASPTLQGARNQFYRNAPAWQVFGIHRITPPYAALPFTEQIGDHQYLRMVFDCGEAPGSISDIRIGDTAITEFFDSETVIHGAAGPASLTMFSNDVNEEPDLGKELHPTIGPETNRNALGPSISHQFAQDGDEFSFDLRFIAGLRTIGEKGTRIVREVDLFIEVQRVDGAFTKQNLMDSVNPPSPIRFGGQGGALFTRVSIFDGAPGPPGSGDHLRIKGFVEVPFTISIGFQAYDGKGTYRVTLAARPVSDNRNFFATNRGGTGALSFAADDIEFTTARSISHSSPINVEDRLLLEVRLQADGQLNGIVDNLNCIVDNWVAIYDGASWLPKESSQNPAWQCTHVLREHFDIPDSRLDLVEFKRFADLCEPIPSGFLDVNSRPHNRVIDFDTDPWTVCNDILSAGFASLGIRDGVYYPIIEERKSLPVQHCTAMNTNNLAFTRTNSKRPHAIRMKFINPDADWLVDELLVYDDGYGLTAAASPSLTYTFSLSEQSVSRADAGSFVTEGFTENTWASHKGMMATGRWTGRSVNALQMLIKTVTDSKLFFYPGTIATDGTAGGMWFETLPSTEFETLELGGVGFLPTAWRHGRRLFTLGSTRLTSTSFDMDWEHLMCRRGDMVYHSHWVLDKTDSRRWGRVRETRVTGSFLTDFTLDSDVTYEAGKSYGVVARLADGTTYTDNVVNLFDTEGVEDSNRIDPDGIAVAATSAKVGDLVSFGEVSEIFTESTIIGIAYADENNARISVYNHSGDAIDDWLAEPVAESKLTSVEREFPERRVPPAPSFRYLGITFLDTTSFNAITAAQLLPRTGNTDKFGEQGYGVLIVVAPGSSSGTEAETEFYHIQYRIGGGDSDLPSSWIDDESPQIKSKLRHIPLKNFTVPFDAVTVSDLVDVRARAVSPFGVRSAWVQVDGIPFRDSFLTPPKGLKTKSVTILTSSGIQTVVKISWDHDAVFSNFRVRVQDENQIIKDEIVAKSEISLIDNTPGEWTVTVSGIAAAADLNAPVALPAGRFSNPAFLVFEYDPNTPNLLIPEPTGLRLIGRPLGEFNTTGPSYDITWNAVSFSGNSLDGDVVDAGPAEISGFDGYQVQVSCRETGKVHRTETVEASANPEYHYTLDMNKFDGKSNVGSRFITFKVSAIVAGVIGKAAVFSPTNPAPPLPGLVSGRSSLAGFEITLDWRLVTDPGLAGLIIWARDGSTPLNDSELTPERIAFRGAAQDVTFIKSGVVLFTYRYAAFDKISDDPARLNVSASFQGGSGGLIDEGQIIPGSRDNIVFDPGVSIANANRYDFDFRQSQIFTDVPTQPVSTGEWGFENASTMTHGRVTPVAQSFGQSLRYTFSGDEGPDFTLDPLTAMYPAAWFGKGPNNINTVDGKAIVFPGDIFQVSCSVQLRFYNPADSVNQSFGSVFLVAQWFDSNGVDIGIDVERTPFDGPPDHFIWETISGQFGPASAGTAYGVFGVAINGKGVDFGGGLSFGDEFFADNLQVRRAFNDNDIAVGAISELFRQFNTAEDGSGHDGTDPWAFGITDMLLQSIPVNITSSEVREVVATFSFQTGSSPNNVAVWRKETGIVSHLDAGNDLLDSSKTWDIGEISQASFGVIVLRPGGPNEERVRVNDTTAPTRLNPLDVWTIKPAVGNTYEVYKMISGEPGDVAVFTDSRETVSGYDSNVHIDSYEYQLARWIGSAVTSDIEGQILVLKK